MATAKIADPPARGRGRPPGHKHDPEVVRDISEQALIAFYNTPRGQVTLAKRIKDDPGFAAKLRDKAIFSDAIVRSWLDVLAQVPRNHTDYQRELMFRFWCLRLEPPMTSELLAANKIKEQQLRGVYMKHCTEENWQRNCKPWIDAIHRVQHDHHVALNVPDAEEEDEW